MLMTKEDFKDIANRVADERAEEVMELIRSYCNFPRTRANDATLLNSIQDLVESERTAHFQGDRCDYYKAEA